MRITASAVILLFAMASCSTGKSHAVTPYQQPNSLMAAEINQRIDQIPYQHREELIQNLLWLSQTGEQTIPSLLNGLQNDSAKVRSSCCWVLGRLRDRRTVPVLQDLVDDREPSVAMEAARTLVLMGDLQQAPKLIAGLDSDRKEVRYMCHEALKSSTGHDFGYDHLDENQHDLQVAVLRWRQWWGEYAGDTFFATSYEQEHGLNNLAAPAGETKLPAAATPSTAATPETTPAAQSSEKASTDSASNLPGGAMATPSQTASWENISRTTTTTGNGSTSATTSTGNASTGATTTNGNASTGATTTNGNASNGATTTTGNASTGATTTNGNASTGATTTNGNASTGATTTNGNASNGVIHAQGLPMVEVPAAKRTLTPNRSKSGN